MPVSGEKYRHYKSTGGDDHTYEVIGLAKYTETGDIFVAYKPLYNIDNIGNFDMFVRPISMRSEEVVIDGNIVKRFIKIG